MNAYLPNQHSNQQQPTTNNKKHRPAFHIESKIGGYCGLCNVPGVVGNGTNSCELSDQCSGLHLPTPAKKFAAAAE